MNSRPPFGMSYQCALLANHNAGLPLDDDTHMPPWGKNGIGTYFHWAAAKKKAFDAPLDIARRRAQRGAMIELTYDKHTLEILERGSAIRAQLSWPSHLKSLHRSDFAFGTARSLSAADTTRIAEIIAKRGVRY